ncbi:MAG: sugar kinase [Defluviitaleaceae bacterium]|nr:sugar kinase [Defluviitaleaceae bacterium]
MKRVVCFGEIMMRLNPKGYLRFVQAKEFEATFSGGEANVAVALSNYGLNSAYVTKVPAHEIGQCAVNELRRFGVDVSGIVRGGKRLGTYYVEKGASQRASKVIYDRADSAIALVEPGEFDWEKLLAGADWFHTTGITPALGDQATKATLDAVKTAKKLGVTVSCDLNYRKNLWSKEKAKEVMTEVIEYVDVVIANEEDAYDVFGIKAEGSDVTKGEISHEGYISVAKTLVEKYNLQKAAITLRTSLSASDNLWSAMLYDGKEAYFAPEYKVHIVDRVGGGDSFGSGLIYSLLSGYNNQKALNFAVAASCLKHSIEHDFNLMSVAEVEALAGGDASGRVQR